jgi:hypothetical protein
MKFARTFLFLLFFLLLFGGMALAFFLPSQSPVQAQQPTGSIPTVTGTPRGVVVAVYLDRQQEYVYAGPSEYDYPRIGVVLAGQQMTAYGLSENGNYVQIYYPGVPDSVAWIYAPYVKVVQMGELPELPAPPTPTAASTPVVNINPTLEAAFVTRIPPTRMPTFTAPAPLVIATFVDGASNLTRVPLGLLILGFGFIGALGTLISFLRGR